LCVEAQDSKVGARLHLLCLCLLLFLPDELFENEAEADEE